MISNESMNVTSNHLYNMLSSGHIVIPIIQRDYAQGRERENTRAIANSFVKDILEHLAAGNKMKLSFVYGAMEGQDFIPYDGQQRLTLMFLIALYLAKYAGQSAGLLAGFRYETRDFSTDFCSYLTGDEFLKGRSFRDIANAPVRNAIYDAITDDAAFFTEWLNDPTVCSMINVLQTINAVIGALCKEKGITNKESTAKEMLERIKSGEVFFDWCKISASDNVYVRMNGRGKALSAYDNFKNTLFGTLDGFRRSEKEGVAGNNEPLSHNEQSEFLAGECPPLINRTKVSFLKDFEQKTDGAWTDLFWKHREAIGGKGNVDVAGAMINFLRFAFEYRLNARTEGFFFDKKDNPIRYLSETNIMSFIDVFKKAEVTIDDYVWLAKLLDTLCWRDENGKMTAYESDLLVNLGKKASTPSGVDYRTCIEASFYFECLIGLSQFDENGHFQAAIDRYCEEWKRFVIALMETTKFFDSHFNDLLTDKYIYATAWKTLTEKIIAANGDIGEALAAIYDNKSELKEMSGHFVSHTDSQFWEECLKTSLIKTDDAWKEKIAQANSLPYFGGQVYFLFVAAKRDDGVAGYKMDAFDKFTKAAKVLTLIDNNTDKLCDNEMRQILLSFGDYRVKCQDSYSNTRTLCTSTVGDGPKYASWRNFFDLRSCDDDEAEKRGDFIKMLLNAIVQNDYSIEAAVSKAREAVAGRYDWMSTLVLYPELLKRMGAFGIVHTNDWGNYLITSGAVKRQVRENTLDSYSININIFRIYMELGFGDADSFWQETKDIWKEGKREIRQTSWNCFVVKDGFHKKSGTAKEVMSCAK